MKLLELHIDKHDIEQDIQELQKVRETIVRNTSSKQYNALMKELHNDLIKVNYKIAEELLIMAN